MVGGEAATITLELGAPQQALADDSGLYLDGQRLATFCAGNLVSTVLPPVTADRVRLELRAQGWIPQQVVPGSRDARTVGVQLFRLTLKSASAGPTMFDANTGRKIE